MVGQPIQQGVPRCSDIPRCSASASQPAVSASDRPVRRRVDRFLAGSDPRRAAIEVEPFVAVRLISLIARSSLNGTLP